MSEDPKPQPAKPRFGCLRKFVMALSVFVVLLAVVRFGAEIKGGRTLDGLRETWKAETESERSRLSKVHSPVLRGTPIDENAAPRYRKLLKDVEGVDLTPLGSLDDLLPGKPLPEKAGALLGKNRATVAALREAVRCNRCDLELELEKGVALQLPGILPARTLGRLVVLEGYERAASGDVEGAAQRFLDVVRYGTDLDGPLILVMIRAAIVQDGLDALVKLVVAQDLPGPPPASIRGELGKLAPVLEDLEPYFGAFRIERLTMEKLALDADPSAVAGESPWALFASLSPRAFFGFQLPGFLEVFAEQDRVARIEDPDERKRTGDALEKRVGESGNLLVRLSVRSLAAARSVHERAVAKLRLVDTACSIESRRSADGKYPQEVSDLPADPFAQGAKLHYAPTADATGYTLTSKGDGGPNSVRTFTLERKSASAK